jgi:penicillin-binding protein/type II secretion system (T2SS) protein G
MNDKPRTIVGGRSRSNRLVGNFPRAIEILLKKASVNPEFSQYLLQDPLNAALSIALDLKLVEINILKNTSKPVLEKMIASIRVPKQHIKTFRTATVTAMMAVVLSTTVVLPVLAGGGHEDLPAQTIEQEEFTRNRMAMVQEALEAYKMEYGTYPSTSTWYELPGPLAEYAPINDLYDPWKRRFHYNSVKKDGKIVNYKLESLGLDVNYPEDNILCPIATVEHSFAGICPVNILFPVNGDTIILSNNTDNVDGYIQARAEHTDTKGIVQWYLNGVKVGITIEVHNLILRPEFVRNTLLLVDAKDVSASITFSAVKKEVSQ